MYLTTCPENSDFKYISFNIILSTYDFTSMFLIQTSIKIISYCSLSNCVTTSWKLSTIKWQ